MVAKLGSSALAVTAALVLDKRPMLRAITVLIFISSNIINKFNIFFLIRDIFQ